MSEYISFIDGKIAEQNKAYYKTNENLVDLYQKVDFRNKKVLSVVGSGDQIITSNYLLAKKTDCFDVTKLAIYYYYLRKWSILIYGDLYPNIYSNTYLRDVISKIKPRSNDEYEALCFFKKLIKYHISLESMFYDIYIQPEGKTLYKNTKYIKQYVKENPRFYLMDLFTKNIPLNKQYDIMVISNILDWARSDQKKIEIAKKNIEKLVVPGGTILCSNIVTRDMRAETEVFEDNFEYEDYGRNIGYTYKRTK